ncbi:MAG: dihydroflavonol-4-reductase [Desulforhopalus sp.]|jgi:dihydroflavonol-4-reductase
MNNSIPQGTKVMVTGATGFTGKVLVTKLLAQGLKVNAIARNSSNVQPFEGMDITWFRGEVYDEATVKAAMQDVEYVFHVAAAFREAKSTEQDYRNVHLVSTQLIVSEGLKNPNFKRLVHVSTMGVHGHIPNPPGSEESPFSPGDGYQRTKVEAEEWLKTFTASQPFPYTIIRPCAIYGPGEPRLLKLFKMAAGKVFPILGKGKCWYHLVHVEDLANAIILAATAEKALGEAFIIGATEPIRLEDMATIMAKEYNTQLRVLRLPIGPFFLLGDICELLCRPFKIEPPIYRRRVAFYSKDRNFSTRKMQEVLGYTPLWSNEEGIIESARWYLKNNWLKLKK